MKFIKQILIVIFTGVVLSCCSQKQQARRPISQSSGSFLKESIERNKKLISGEEEKIDSIIKSNPEIKYIASNKGYWYSYDTKNTQDTLRPKKGDVAHFNYEIKDLDGNIIYSELELRPQTYFVDQEQKMIIGLRHGLKLMRKNETVTFLFPSHMGYGYHGDDRRIGHNQPLMYKVTLTDFTPETNKKSKQTKPTKISAE